MHFQADVRNQTSQLREL